ncbi:MAG: hypothetical protein A3G25_05390 [Betaproteobacteria bacterium RIFCSPLOWO2_12_FULL_63_13]|nr:MAG: hypothetical protein A3G25_05390 [Betaproteobacteria bacterium RIFCSPLOWO2_12_FULL_63_13]
MNGLNQHDLQNLIAALRRCGVVYAVLFGSAARGELRAASDIAVAAERPLASEMRYRIIQAIAAVGGRPVDLVDLKTARGVLLARALQGRELFCDSVRAKGEALFRRVSVAEEDIAYARKSFALAQPKMFQ